jgi:TPR repeat protein
MRELRVICAATLCLLGQAAFAGYDEALAALQKKDYATAHPELLIAANKGDARAWNALGVMYLQGLGVKRNDSKALEYFEKAAGLHRESLVQRARDAALTAMVQPEQFEHIALWREEGARSSEGELASQLTSELEQFNNF